MGTVRLTCGNDVRESEVAAWAISHLSQTFTSRGIGVRDGEPTPSDDLIVTVTFTPASAEGAEAEAFHLSQTGNTLHVTGSDGRGLAYGVLELADIVTSSDHPIDALLDATPIGHHTPTTPVRSVLRTLAADTQDLSWFHDHDFWDAYLTHLATHRINRFHLALGMQYNYSHDPGAVDNYLAFAYPFLVAPEGFDVRPTGVSDAERQRNLASLRHISEQARRRGIHFQLGLWNHSFTFPDSPHERYPITGLTPETVAEYCRAALREVLLACPAIDGVTVRVHYEGGVHEPSHEFWSIVLQGIAEVGRPIELDMHSKGLDERILDAARETAGAFLISAKFWAEHWGLPYHQAAVREMEYAKPERSGLSGVTRGSRRFTRYGYGDFLPEDRSYGLLFRIWPGTQRILEWADPAQIAAIARSTAAIGGRGVELCEPLTFLGRKTTGTFGHRQIYNDPELAIDGDPWTKYADTYRLWGRMLYEPDSGSESWSRALEHTHGSAGAHLGDALTSASRILPLVTTYHSPSASNNFYWPEMYVNMPVAHEGRSEHYAFDTPEPGSVGAVSPFDPEMFAPIDAFVEEILSGRRSGRYSPLDVASWLDDLVATADRRLTAAAATTRLSSPTLRRTTIDIAVLARLGEFYAEKTRASLHYALFTRVKAQAHLRDAVGHYRRARDAFAAVVNLTDGVYVNDLAFGDRFSERGHWADRLPAIEQDLADLEAELAAVPASADRAVAQDLSAHAARFRPPVTLQVSSTYVPGQSVEVQVDVPLDLDCRVALHYRHLNQGEEWTTTPTQSLSGTRTGIIPEAYTDARYALQVYATIHTTDGDAWIVPGFNATRTNQPYLVLRPAGGPV